MEIRDSVMSKIYNVLADFEFCGRNEKFKSLYFALKAAKVALKRGAKVTITVVQPTPTKQDKNNVNPTN